MPYTIRSSWITFHHFISRELYLVIIPSWVASKTSGQILFCNLSSLTSPLLANDFRNHYVRNFWGSSFFHKDFMCIASKNSRGINFVILAFRMVTLLGVSSGWATGSTTRICRHGHANYSSPFPCWACEALGRASWGGNLLGRGSGGGNLPVETKWGSERARRAASGLHPVHRESSLPHMIS